MELTPNKSPLLTNIHELFQQLALVMEKAQPAEREEFKQSWLKGAERMNRETARLREERVSH